jgi:hypothetical protein
VGESEVSMAATRRFRVIAVPPSGKMSSSSERGREPVAASMAATRAARSPNSTSLMPVATIAVMARLRGIEFSRARVSIAIVSRSAWLSSTLRRPPKP